MNKAYLRQQIANKRKEIVDLKAKKTRLTEDKKNRLESIARSLKHTTNANNKSTYKKQQVDIRVKFANDSEQIKKQIANIQEQIKKLQEQVKNAKN